MIYRINTDETSGCTWRRIQRTTRRLTQVYERYLLPSGITANQFDLLANLGYIRQSGEEGISMGALAAQLGMHPTTLNRDLRPLAARRLVSNIVHAKDRRVRFISITPAGVEALRRAIPLWRQAQRRLQAELGRNNTRELNALLDLVFDKFAARSR